MFKSENSPRCVIATLFISVVGILLSSSLALAKTDTRSLCLSEAVKSDERVSACGAAIKKNRKEARLWIARAIVFGAKGEYDQAISDLSEAIKLNPQDATIYSKRSQLWAMKGDEDQAIADLNEAIRLNPQEAAYINRGSLWEKKGERQKALEDFNRCIELNPSQANCQKAVIQINSALAPKPTDDTPTNAAQAQSEKTADSPLQIFPFLLIAVLLVGGTISISYLLLYKIISTGYSLIHRTWKVISPVR